MQMKATVTKTYYCAWKCTRCGQVHAETAHLMNTAESSAGFTVQKAADKARAKAEKKSEKDFAKMVRNVNEHRSILQLTAAGKCPACGEKQPWVKPTSLRIIACLVLVAIVAAVALPSGRAIGMWLIQQSRSVELLRNMARTVLEQPYLPAVVLCAILLPLMWLLTGALHNRHALRTLEETRDPACYPLVMVAPLPEGIDTSDERVQAAFALVVRNMDKVSG